MQKKKITGNNTFKIFVTEVTRVFGDCSIQDERGIWMPINEDWKNKQFDIDLDFGKATEKKLADAFEGKSKLEVKTERWEGKSTQWKRTGNIAIEVRCRGKLSGLSITEAELWIHMLDDGGGGFIFKTEHLKNILRKMRRENRLRLVNGGDIEEGYEKGVSQLALIPISELFKQEDKQIYMEPALYLTKFLRF